MLRTGVIADDFTGATDIASAYVRRGHRAVVLTRPAAVEPDEHDGHDVLVVALKSRTAPVDRAVADSLAALDALRAAGCERFVFKYCSTFDSTDAGNIGPVLDALADRLEAERSVVVPSFPDNGRTVYRGHLFVGATLLEHSPMRHHPLTPMTRSRIAEILAPQTSAPVAEVHLDVVQSTHGADLRAAIDAADGRWVVVDAVSDDDLVAVAEATADHVLVSGAAGLALGVAQGSADPGDVVRDVSGRRLVVCGSASARTVSRSRTLPPPECRLSGSTPPGPPRNPRPSSPTPCAGWPISTEPTTPPSPWSTRSVTSPTSTPRRTPVPSNGCSRGSSMRPPTGSPRRPSSSPGARPPAPSSAVSASSGW